MKALTPFPSPNNPTAVLCLRSLLLYTSSLHDGVYCSFEDIDSREERMALQDWVRKNQEALIAVVKRIQEETLLIVQAALQKTETLALHEAQGPSGLGLESV